MTTLSDLDGEWNLIELNGDAVTSEQHRQFIVFDVDQKRYSGSAGCNRMSGEFEYDKNTPDKIRFSRAMTTRMACPILESEQKFLVALEEAVRFEVTSSGIALYNAGNTKSMVIKKK